MRAHALCRKMFALGHTRGQQDAFGRDDACGHNMLRVLVSPKRISIGMSSYTGFSCNMCNTCKAQRMAASCRPNPDAWACQARQGNRNCGVVASALISDSSSCAVNAQPVLSSNVMSFGNILDSATADGLFFFSWARLKTTHPC